MASEVDRKAIEKYFAKFPKWAIWLAIAGVITAVVGSDGVMAAGVAMTFVGIATAVSALMGKASDEDMDNCIAEDMVRTIAKSLQKTSTDESELIGEPVVVTGPRPWDTGGAKILHKKGKDGRLRFTPMNVSILHMTPHQLISYQCCLDLTTGNCLNESTDEYFYRDVVSVATKTTSLSRHSEKFGTVQLDDAEAFVLTTSGGTSVETVLRDPKLIEMMGGGEIPTTDAEKAIQVVRKMLREKKQAA